MTERSSKEASAAGDSPAETISLCSIVSAGELFGVDTKEVREVLDRQQVRRVPLAPAYVGGLISYRGEVLTIISLRALLGQADQQREVSVLVLEDGERQERFGLAVDVVDGVKNVSRSMLKNNPCTLDGKTDAIFAGVFKTPQDLIVYLDPHRLLPSRLARTGL